HKVFDADGNSYIDFVMSYGPQLLGHAHPAIVSAVQESAQKSFGFGLSTESEIRWAEALLKFFPKAERVRAMSTGTEATATAIRLARGVTGRNIIVKCSGHYHGHVDWLMVDSGSGIATLAETPVADSKGLPPAVVENSVV